ncbi:hypothetical protein DSM112329_04727 [Paraconexibacter sp. AEG42_29]|uniref:PASTA domain-containing protein n=1 Tax=Paraconexibacter sp. AEG42_29 TaxID=2997339 RepID=A0AAU7B1T8_9ACTN
MTLRIIVAAATSALLLAACGESTSSDTQTVAAPAQTVTVTETTTAAAAPTPEPETTTSAAAAEPDEADAGSSGDCIVVPDVEGGDHQLAQDTMQAAGLYSLDEEDATGQDRLLIVDRNWTVESQRPAAGKCVSEDTTVLLRSKKDGE